MFWNVIPYAYAYAVDRDSDDAEYGYRYAVFAEALRFANDGSSKLAEVVAKLGEETGAACYYDSGFTEGTFFFRTKKQALAAEESINRHIERWVVDTSSRRTFKA